MYRIVIRTRSDLGTRLNGIERLPDDHLRRAAHASSNQFVNDTGIYWCSLGFLGHSLDLSRVGEGKTKECRKRHKARLVRSDSIGLEDEALRVSLQLASSSTCEIHQGRSNQDGGPASRKGYTKGPNGGYGEEHDTRPGWQGQSLPQ
jgi:hypothetical protein